MSIPKEPRQMMINMMYLVLTAMLALNVSAEILNAFTIVNEGIKRTNKAIESKNVSVYAAFDKKAEDDPTAQDERDAAYEIKAVADNLVSEIDGMITDIKDLVGVMVNENGQELGLKNPKDTHKGTKYLINDGNAGQLKESILAARVKMLGFFDENIQEDRGKSLPLNAEDPEAKEGVSRTWAEFNFYEVPAVAQLTVLNKLKNDVRNSEAQLLEYLGARINADKFTFDALKGRAISNNPYVNQGETYESDIFVSATSSAANPKVHIGSFSSRVEKDDNGDYKEIKGGEVPLQAGYRTLEEAEAGIVRYSATASSTGKKTYTGVIEIVNPNTGETSFYPFQGEYTVAGSMAVVSPEKMNVLYIGVDNPVSVSAPGFQPQQISPSISAGNITSRGEAGKYNVRVSEAGDVKITLTGKKDGDVSRIGSADFRVKRIPDPNIYAGNRKSGVIGAGELRALTGIYAKADGFDFDVRFDIIGFEFTYKKARQNQLRIIENRGTLFNPEVKDILRNVGPGDQVWLDNIRVKSPDNTTRVANMSLKVI